MLSHSIKLNPIFMVLSLRTVAIVIQIILLLFVHFVLHYHLPWFELVIIICCEVIFTFGSYWYFRKKQHVSKQSLSWQVIADVIFLSALLSYSGGATNAFVSLLLIPIAISAVTLSAPRLFFVACLAIASYSVQLWLMPMSVMHGNMEGHFIGMWINFLFSALVVALVVGRMAINNRIKDKAIAQYREEQLKQEKVISLGVASAQVTHQLATPISTACMLVDELKELSPTSDLINDLQFELKRCTDSLSSFRQMVFDIKEQNTYLISATRICADIKDYIALNHPELMLVTVECSEGDDRNVQANSSLLPAIINIINNAIRATQANNCQKVEIKTTCDDEYLTLEIRDFGKGFTQEKLAQLGIQPIASDQGFGMAVLLSHSSFERLGGKLVLTNHNELGAIATISLPLVL
ncbi:ATP-binding protein [Thalassotalea profundi]|uniref:histidine kinase n=1 Tax=Thalassotalea profundi TaxID=2036687 RepID=A0ABQ3IJT1_9GAMM|nr:ATP-binding protein [Thalassotalea profundi]GHE81738.1 histidine kinase [Thalassotalea profundi]